MTFDALKQAVYAECGYAVSPASAHTAVIARVGLWLNEGQRRILRQPSMTDLRQGTIEFGSVAGQPIYGLPQVFERIDAIVQQTNDRKLRFMSRSSYRSVDPGERSSGLPDYYVPVGLWPVLRQPSQGLVAGTGVWAVSSDPADITQKVNLQGVEGVGDVRPPVQVTITGTTRVQVGTFPNYIEILSWNLDTACAGTVFLYDAVTAGNLLARIPPGSKSVQYQAMRLWPTPTNALQYTVDGQFLIQDMIQATDVPMLPPSYHDVLVDYARMKEYERTGDKRLSLAAQQYLDGVTKLRVYVQFPPGYSPVAGSMDAAVRRNNLGSYYPADWGLL